MLLRKILYGSGEFGLNGLEVFLRLHLLAYANNQLWIPAQTVGWILFVTLAWDAIIDPSLGAWSDSFARKKFGRWPLVLIGAAGTALSVLVLFQIPVDWTLNEKIFSLVGLNLLMNSFFALTAIPYSAIVNDVTTDRKERSQWVASRFLWGNLGALFGVAIPGYFLNQSIKTAYENSGWIFSLIILATLFLASLSHRQNRERPLQESGPPKVEHRKISLIRSLGGGHFPVLLGAFFVLNIGLAVNSAGALYFYRLRLLFSELEIQKILLLFFLVFSLSIPLWIAIGNRWSRKRALMVGGLLLGISTTLIYPLLPEKNFVAALIFASVIGGVLVGSAVLLETLVADLIENESRKSGVESSGFFFGIWRFSGKLSRATGLLVAGQLLGWAQVNEPNAETLPRLSLLFGPVVGCFFILSAFCIWKLKINEQELKPHDIGPPG